MKITGHLVKQVNKPKVLNIVDKHLIHGNMFTRKLGFKRSVMSHLFIW